jgi:hypothetical protein
LTVKIKADVIAKDEGSLWLFIPKTDQARQFMDLEVQSEPWQWLGGGLAVEHRYAQGLIQLLEEEGGFRVFQF